MLHRAITATVLLAALGDATAQRPERPPNILVVVTDDQRWDALGHAGHPIVTTPTLDRLAREGVRFSNAFVTTSICAASRASILTGRYEGTHRFSFRAPPLRRELTDESYPRLLRAAGYHTGLLGKFGVKTTRGATRAMFDVFGPAAAPYRGRDGKARHLSDRLADAAIEFLADRPTDRPFCLSLWFNAPHAEDSNPEQYVWPEDLDRLYADLPVPAPINAEPEFFAGLPEFQRTSMNRARWRWRFDTEDKRARMTRGYYRMIHGADRALGRVLAALHERGLADDTIVVFTSDNGYFLGERGFAGKWLMYEESIRVPLIVVDPRLPAGRRGAVSDAFALNVDLAPTILAMAGVDAPAGMQGRDLSPLLAGRKPSWREDFYYEHRSGIDTIPKSEGVRTARWKYVRYFEQDPPREELYDLERDPHERDDRAADEPERLRELRARCAELRAEFSAGPEGDLLVVANAGDDTLTLIDPKTGDSLRTISVGARPHGVAVAPDGRRAIVADHGGHTLSVVDLTGTLLVEMIDLRGEDRTVPPKPRGVCILSDGRRALVTAEGLEQVLVVDLDARRVTRRIDTGRGGRTVLADRAGERAYVASATSVTILDLDRALAVGSIDLDLGPAPSLALHPRRDELWIAGGGSIRIVDPSGRIVATLRDAAEATDLAFTPDGTRALVCHAAGSVAIFDVERRTPIAEVELPAGDATAEHGQPTRIVVAPDGALAYVIETGADRISVIDLAAGRGAAERVVGSLRTGRSPRGSAWRAR